MNNNDWVYVCEKDSIELEGLRRFDYNQKTYCI